MKVGELVAELTLDTSGMTKGVDKASTEAKRLDANMQSLKTGTVIAAGALTAIGAAAMEAANRAGEYADQIKEVATITGMSTDQVQRWKYAADQSGVSFDALTVTMRMLTQNIQNVDDKNSSLKASLDAIGVSAKTASGGFKDTNTIMLETLTALKNMDDPIKRNTIAMQLYGRSWSELADFMEKDVDLAKLFAQADPISKAKLDAAENYKNKMGALGGQIDQVTVKIGSSLIPALNILTNWFAGAVPYITGFIDAMLSGIDRMAVTAAGAADIVNGISNRVYGTNYSTDNAARVTADIQARNRSSSDSYGSYSPGSGIGISGGVSDTSISGDGGTQSAQKQWTAQDLYNKYASGNINKAQLDSMLAKEGMTGAVVQTASGQYYNTSTGMYANTATSAGSTNPYANNDAATPGQASGTQWAATTTTRAENMAAYQAYVASAAPIATTRVARDSDRAAALADPEIQQMNRVLGFTGDEGFGRPEYQEILARKYPNWAPQLATEPTGYNPTQILSYGDWTKLYGQYEAPEPTPPSAPVEAPTVTSYGTSFGGYASSGAIKSSYQMGIQQNNNGTITVNLLLDGKVVAQSVVDNLASAGVRI